jgi:hypothetical protein
MAWNTARSAGPTRPSGWPGLVGTTEHPPGAGLAALPNDRDWRRIEAFPAQLDSAPAVGAVTLGDKLIGDGQAT